jgi:hypothetical protein
VCVGQSCGRRRVGLGNGMPNRGNRWIECVDCASSAERGLSVRVCPLPLRTSHITTINTVHHDISRTCVSCISSFALCLVAFTVSIRNELLRNGPAGVTEYGIVHHGQRSAPRGHSELRSSVFFLQSGLLIHRNMKATMSLSP